MELIREPGASFFYAKTERRNEMRVLSLIYLKGGVAKTLSSVNMAYILAAVHKKVLLIDNDKQGNASKILNRHSYDRPGVAEILTGRDMDMKEIIQHTDYEGLDIVTANMNLISASLAVMLEQKRPQQTRFKKAFGQAGDGYDFCIIDNAPDINISTINALGEYPLLETYIRRTGKMKPSTFAREPILLYSSRCGASRDYKALAEEYLKMCPGWTQQGGEKGGETK